MKKHAIAYIILLISILSLSCVVYAHVQKVRVYDVNVLKAAKPFEGKYKNAAVEVYGSLDGSLKIKKTDADNISRRLIQRLSEDNGFTEVQRYVKGKNNADLNIFIYVQEVIAYIKDVENYVNTPFSFNHINLSIPVSGGTAYNIYIVMTVKLIDAKTLKLLGEAEIKHTTGLTCYTADDVLSTEDIEPLNERISTYLATLEKKIGTGRRAHKG